MIKNKKTLGRPWIEYDNKTPNFTSIASRYRDESGKIKLDPRRYDY